MSKLGCIIFILPLIGYLHFVLTAQTQLKSLKEGTSTVSGRVTINGEPARGVTVVLHSPMREFFPDPGSPPGAKTDENGRFRITKVTAGAYFVRAIAPGLVAAAGVSFEPEGKSLNLANGEIVENIDLELKPGGVITGRVVDSEGHPLVEEYVNLMKLDTNGKPGYVHFEDLYGINRTDDRGIYRIYGLPEGRYLVNVGIYQGEDSFSFQSNPTYHPRTFHPNVTSVSDAKVVEVSEGAEVTGVDITVAEARKAYNVYGRVVNAETGKGVAQAWISYGSVSSDGRITGLGGSRGDQSDEKGEFHLRGMLPGKIALSAEGNQDSEFYSDPVICEINNSDVRGVEIKVRQAGSISGVVVIEGTNDPAILNKLSKIQNNAVLHRMDPIRGSSMPVTVNPDGSFRAKGVTPGKNVFLLWENPELQGLTLLRVERDGVMYDEGFEVGPGEQVSNVRVVLNYGILVIRGEVKIVGGTLPKNVGLYVDSSGINIPLSNRSNIDSRGQFMIKNLSPGEYELSLFHPISIPGEEQVDEHLLKAISQVKQRVIVTTDNQPQVTLMLDLSRREGNH